jgi:5-methylcytosine-specific restriction endonuclease McrA
MRLELEGYLCYWGSKGFCDGQIGIGGMGWCDQDPMGEQGGIHCEDYGYLSFIDNETMKDYQRIPVPKIRRVLVDSTEVAVFVAFCYECGRRVRLIKQGKNDSLNIQLAIRFKFYHFGRNGYFNFCLHCKAHFGWWYVEEYIKRYPFSYYAHLKELYISKKDRLARTKAKREYKIAKLIDDEYWHEQRITKLKQENYTCERCGKRNWELKSLNLMGVHHIKPRRCFTLNEYKTAHDLSNLKVLCAKCHGVEEKKSRKTW